MGYWSGAFACGALLCAARGMSFGVYDSGMTDLRSLFCFGLLSWRYCVRWFAVFNLNMFPALESFR